MSPEFSITDEVRNSNKLANMIESAPYDRESAVSNYRKLFTRGSSVTKEILERVQHAEMANKKKVICGYELKTRQIWMLAGLVILFSFSLFGSIVLWYTNIFDEHVKAHLVLKNGSESFDSWHNPTTRPFMRVHIFNYTNVEEFEAGIDTKLNVTDVGPYTFEEYIQRINTVFNEDGTLTYQEKKSYKFRPDMSKGHKQSDRVIVPNMPMISAIVLAKDTNWWARAALNTLLTGLNAKPFLNLPAHRFIWGYEDNFFNLVKGAMVFHKPLPYNDFGVLAHKNGTNSNKITIKTGLNDVNTIGTIVKINEETSMGHWSTKECNRMDGTDGSFFGPDIIRSKKPVNIYHRDLCRKLPFHFQKEHNILGHAPSYRYSPPTTIFAEPDVEPSNQCFCHVDTGSCPPHGVFNATPCSFGPAYISFPHFMHGDPALLEPFNGLNPDEEEHSMYLDIHPTLGFTMAGLTKLQVNVMARRVFGLNQLDMFEEETMLPVAWFDVGLDAESLPKSVVDIIYRTSFTIPRIEIALRYGCLTLLLITTTSLAVLLFRSRTTGNVAGRRLERNISGLDALIQ